MKQVYLVHPDSSSLVFSKLREELKSIGILVKYISVDSICDEISQCTIPILFCLTQDRASQTLEKIESLPESVFKMCLICDGCVKNLNSQALQHFDDFYHWPCTKDELIVKLKWLTNSATKSSELGDDSLKNFYQMDLIGKSEKYLELVKGIEQVSKYPVPILIEGETGTGKENTARAIHYLSSRTDFGFIPINCGSIPENLFESELFGVKKGAFTDAQADRQGLIDLADKGTLFLDEVDSLPLKSQATLLRFLQNNEYRSLGSQTIKKSNAAIVAACNQPLEELVKEGKFRSDLYYRLNVLNLKIPPLRQRIDDIDPIADYLIKKFQRKYRTKVVSIHSSYKTWLKQQHWPGNIRELENRILSDSLKSESPELSRFQFTVEKVTDSCSYQQAKQDAINSFEKSYLEDLLKQTNGNISEASRRSGKERRALGKLVKKHGLKADHYL